MPYEQRYCDAKFECENLLLSNIVVIIVIVILVCCMVVTFDARSASDGLSIHAFISYRV